MKVLKISHETDGHLHVDAGADSAILRVGEPVFVPEDPIGWRSAVAPAIRISRLGTAIHEKSAAAYYDSLTLVHMLIPSEATHVSWLPPMILDRAIAPGITVETSALPPALAIDVNVGKIGAEVASAVFSKIFDFKNIGIDSIISEISRHLTFRTGDLLIFDDCSIDLGIPRINNAIKASLNGEKILDIRLK